MKIETHQIGRRGEDLAADFYVQNGFTILERNWHCYHLEVDMIARNEDTLVICEVKTRSSIDFGEPETFVTPQKQKNLIRAANMYLTRTQLNLEVRFDIVSVTLCGNDHQLHHIPSAFQPKW